MAVVGLVISSNQHVTAQLKVNLRPLWTPTAAALSALASRFGDLVWGLLFRELQAASSPSIGSSSEPEWLQGGLEDEGDDVWEEERSWRDPSAHKTRTVLARWLGHSAAKRAMVQVCVPRPPYYHHDI